MLKACLGGFPDEAEEQEYTRYKTISLRPLALLLIALELALSVLPSMQQDALRALVAHDKPAVVTGWGVHAAYSCGLLLPLLVPVLAACVDGRPRIGELLSRWRVQLVCLGQSVATAAACVALVALVRSSFCTTFWRRLATTGCKCRHMTRSSGLLPCSWNSRARRTAR